MADFKTLQLTGVSLSTGDYKEDKSGKFKREVQRKTAYLTLTPEAKAALQEFGVTIYTPNDPNADGEIVDFAMVPFAGKTMVYYKELMQKETVVFDDHLPNYSIANADLVITSNVSDQGQTFYRVSALRVANPDAITVFKASYFDDDDTYTEISSNGVNGLFLPGGDVDETN